MMSDILFADDDDAMREVVAATLRAAGHRVRTAPGGNEALAEIRRDPPELAILDYRMGDPDGFEVCKRIKTDGRLAHLPVLILTAEGALEQRLGGYEAGADGYLAKPFDPRELVARATALLRLSRRGLDRNPTSGLPGGRAIQEEFRRRAARDEPVAICYLDLDFFKAFADRFGFSVADAVIRGLGDSLRTTTAASTAFTGHVGGDDFLILCRPDEAAGLVEETHRAFEERLLSLVPGEVAHLRRYSGEDREGRMQEFPLTRLSAAIVLAPPGEFADLDRIGERISRAKAEAKRLAGDGPGIVTVSLADIRDPDA